MVLGILGEQTAEGFDGLQVLANGRISLYPERGDYQLIVQFLEEAGAGALRRAFEALMGMGKIDIAQIEAAYRGN